MRSAISSVSDSTKYDSPSGSITSAASVSSRMMCWVSMATLAASSPGARNGSSYASVCSDWVPPSTAASAWSATRETLFFGRARVSSCPSV